MGIKEEIEKLRRPPYQGHMFMEDSAINDILDDVLSILDEWELVGEGEWKQYGYLYYDNGESLTSIGASICELIRFRLHSGEEYVDVELSPRDTIIIYRRKKR